MLDRRELESAGGPPGGASTARAASDDGILEMRRIVKEFPGVRALDDVSFRVRRGEVHALVGENGAGKSTLMKVLSGVYPFGSYGGEILVDGAVQSFGGIRESEARGIAIIHQETALVKQLNIAENIVLGREPQRLGVVDWDAAFVLAESVMRKVGLKGSAATPVARLGVGEQQLVEIAKALAKEARVLILDEPTAALSEGEAERLLNLLRGLQKEGVTCIYISHRLKEVFALADRITVLRDGRTVGTFDTRDLDEEKLIAHMVGRPLTNRYPRRTHAPGEVVLELEDWAVSDPAGRRTIQAKRVQVRRGEVLGIAGLIGAGRTELAMSLFGLWGRRTGGVLRMDGREVTLRRVCDAIRAGIALASEDRKRYGLVLSQDVKKNIVLAGADKTSRHGVVNEHEEIRQAERFVKLLSIKTPSIEQKVGHLSGGNQQKVVLAKWLLTSPRVLILDEPTRGIDVGARLEVYTIINELVEQGMAVVVISSDLQEVMGVSDRILVMREGRIAGELSASEATQENVMRLATGGG